MTQLVTLLPGDGIGPEITAAVKEILAAAGADVAWEEMLAGQSALDALGSLLPEETLESIRKNGVCLKGPITTPIGKGFRSVNVQMRKRFDLFANIRPVASIPGLVSRFSDVDLTIFRENTEDLYAGIEEVVSENEVHGIKVITRAASERIARAAFEYARAKGGDVTIVTKANIMKKTDGLFLDVAREVASEFADVPVREVLVDAMCMNLVIRPEAYDVILTENLYGDILSDLCAGLIGGLGLAAGANVGADAAIFEAVHGSAPDIAGKGLANPTAMALAACLMLEHIGQNSVAARVRAALFAALADPSTRTADLGGSCSTTEFAAAVVAKLAAGASPEKKAAGRVDA